MSGCKAPVHNFQINEEVTLRVRYCGMLFLYKDSNKKYSAIDITMKTKLLGIEIETAKTNLETAQLGLEVKKIQYKSEQLNHTIMEMVYNNQLFLQQQQQHQQQCDTTNDGNFVNQPNMTDKVVEDADDAKVEETDVLNI